MSFEYNPVEEVEYQHMLGYYKVNECQALRFR